MRCGRSSRLAAAGGGKQITAERLADAQGIPGCSRAHPSSADSASVA